MRASQTEEAYAHDRPREFATVAEFAGKRVWITGIVRYGEQTFAAKGDKPEQTVNFMEVEFEYGDDKGKRVKSELPMRISQAYLFPRLCWFFEHYPDEEYEGVPTLGKPPGSNVTSNCWYFA